MGCTIHSKNHELSKMPNIVNNKHENTMSEFS